MNNDMLKGEWKQLKGEVQKQWNKLTNDDMNDIEGDRNKLEGWLQQRYGYTKEEVKRKVDEFLGNR